MATPIKMPDLGTAVDVVKVVRWLKQVGEPVARGEPLCEVETDKATQELESYAEGVLLWQAVPANTEVGAGSVIAYVGQAGEAVPGAGAERAGGFDTTPRTGSTQPPAGAAPAAANPPRPASDAGHPSGGGEGGAKVSVLIRSLATKLGVDLAKVTGTGPGGAITREDVQRAQAGGGAERAGGFDTTPRTGSTQPAAGAPAAGRTLLSPNQRAVAKRISKSWSEIVPIYLTARFSMRAARALREKRKAATGQAPSYDAILVHAVARLVKEAPRFLGHVEGDEVVLASGIHVGLAVSVGDDLFTPTIRDADQLDLAATQQRITELTEKARARRLTIEEMADACLTISNLGMYPIESFTAIIPPHQSATISVGAAADVAVFRDGSVQSDLQAGVTLAVDHRLINGRQAAEFLAALKKRVETL